jgi:hypothetical protein
MNPFNASVYNLFYHLNTLNGLLFTLDGQLTSFEKLYRESFSGTPVDISMIFSGASLVIRDLTEWSKSGWATYYPSGAFSSKGEEYFKLIKVLLARESSWTISQAYEAFETFLKDVSATLLLKNKGLAETKKVEKFESDKKSNNLTKTDIAFWREYISYHYKTNTEKLKFLRKICPDISKGEMANNRAINLTEWFPVVEELRHSATHSDFIIHANRMKNWSKTKRDILKGYFTGINTDQGYQIDITIKDATFCLELFSEYSFQVYKFLSISRGYDWNILQKKKGE